MRYCSHPLRFCINRPMRGMSRCWRHPYPFERQLVLLMEGK